MTLSCSCTHGNFILLMDEPYKCQGNIILLLQDIVLVHYWCYISIAQRHNRASIGIKSIIYTVLSFLQYLYIALYHYYSIEFIALQNHIEKSKHVEWQFLSFFWMSLSSFHQVSLFKNLTLQTCSQNHTEKWAGEVYRAEEVDHGQI